MVMIIGLFRFLKTMIMLKYARVNSHQVFALKIDMNNIKFLSFSRYDNISLLSIQINMSGFKYRVCKIRTIVYLCHAEIRG